MATVQCPSCSRTLAVAALPEGGGLQCPLCGTVFTASAQQLTPASSPGTSPGEPPRSDAFDPYYTWLGITPIEQPPNHYRLLGISVFETNPDVIENAANRQSAHLRSCSTGPRAPFAQYLLNRVAAARICLLDATRKAEYDDQLRRELAAKTSSPSPNYAPTRRSSSRRPRNPFAELLKIVLGGVVGLAIGYTLLAAYFPDALGRLLGRQVAKEVARKSAPTETPANQKQESSPPVQSPAPKTSSSPASTTDSAPPSTAPKSVDVPVPTNTDRSNASATNNLTNPRTARKNVTRPRSPAASAPKMATRKTPTDANEASKPKKESTKSQASKAPAEPVNPLSQIPTGVALPDSNVREWQTLTPLTLRPDHAELIAAFDPVIAKLSLHLEAQNDCASTTWLVRFEKIFPEGAAHGTLAAFQVEPVSGDLQFRWQGADTVAAAGLANSWLKLDFSGSTKHVSLRTPVAAPPVTLDFDKERNVFPIHVDSVPATDQLYLEIPTLAGLTGNWTFRKDMNTSKVDRELVVESADMPGAQVSFKLAKIPQSPLGLIVEPRFKENAREFDLTYKQLEKTQQAANEQVQEAKAKIPLLERALRETNEAITTVENRRTLNDFQVRQKRLELTKLAAIAKDTSKRLGEMKVQSAAAQTRLDAAPKVVNLLRSLQGKQIPYRVLVKSSSAELVLATGSLGETVQ